MSRTVLVTGASSGFGRAICQTLLKAGDRVIGVARSFERFPCPHPRFAPQSVDLSELDALPAHLGRLARAYPAIDAVVCNAGQGRFGELEQFSYAQIRAALDLNFTSHAYLARAFLPGLKRAGRGDLVFIGSEAGQRGAPKGSLYCAAKFALRGFAQALREESARAGVRVCIVNPGMARTPFYDQLGFEPGTDPDNHILPEDVAGAVATVLAARPGTVFDEISLSPLKRVVVFGNKKDRKGDR